ncbi:hypothetical protein CAEBREN_05345 [Caenorhabditis brenneri]|uniref:F-box associated domain-containing protein n=1 Tax=Caenorhabditis brenneri TaxID=135651 RepID=G0P779_CAEBE|nr:hypothetical protein CAEBREN_05345 [Caenorhabditis brenneri]
MTKKFDYMSLNSGYHIPFSVSPETAKMLMEDITAEKMDLQIKTERFKYEFPKNQVSKIKELNLFRTDFIQSNNFVRNLNHPHVKFLFPSIKKWNKILKEWVNEDNNVIEYLMLFRQSMAFFLQASVLAGIPHRETRFKRNQLKSLVGEDKFNEEMMQSYDIRRFSDSREATIVFSENSVTLHVWTDAQKAKIRNIHD